MQVFHIEVFHQVLNMYMVVVLNDQWNSDAQMNKSWDDDYGAKATINPKLEAMPSNKKALLKKPKN